LALHQQTDLPVDQEGFANEELKLLRQETNMGACFHID